MKTQFKYICFSPHPQNTKTGKWICANTKTGHPLGEVKWCANWRQFCFYPEPQCLFSAGCLLDIVTFIDGLKAAWVDARPERGTSRSNCRHVD